MSKNILKAAAVEAMKQEMLNIPSEEELAAKYPVSRQLAEKIQLIINEYNYKYKSVMGLQIPKKLVSIAGIAVITAVLVWMYYNKTIEKDFLELLIRIDIVFIFAVLFPQRRSRNKEKTSARDFTRQYQPALMDVEDPTRRYDDYVTYGYEFDYNLPPLPAGFTVRNESRMAVRHRAVFDNGRGIKINYVRVYLNGGIPYTVDTAKVTYESFTINENDAISFRLDGENHLIWEDFSSQYHLYGNADMQLMQKIAESMHQNDEII